MIGNAEVKLCIECNEVLSVEPSGAMARQEHTAGEA
jgi:hypothetical protein